MGMHATTRANVVSSIESLTHGAETKILNDAIINQMILLPNKIRTATRVLYLRRYWLRYAPFVPNFVRVVVTPEVKRDWVTLADSHRLLQRDK